MRERVIEIYDSVIAAFDGVMRKGKASAYTAVNGHMYSFVDADGVMCLRLSPDDKAAYEAAHGTGPVIQYGRVMKGYVPVTASLLSDHRALVAAFGQALGYVSSLKSKPTKK